MRKLLLAGVAMVGATAVAGTASAQTAPAPAPPQMKIIQMEGFGKSANDNNNYQAAALPGPVANPTPGTMVVRFNGKIWSEFGFGGGSGYIMSGPTAGLPVGDTEKMAPDSMGTYLRLYPGVDAMATNGLRYGAQAEIRENFRATVGNTSNTINPQESTSATGGSNLTCGQTLYVRRDFVYVAGANWGLIRMGQTDGVPGTFDNGIIDGQNVGAGLWNGDAPAWAGSAGAADYIWYAQQGGEYGWQKIMYLSPQFYGFDFGADWGPNNGNQEAGPFNAASTGVPALTSSASQPAGERFTNQYALGARYQGTFGPVAVYGFGTYIGSGHVNYNGPAVSGGVAGSSYNGSFQNLSAGFGGVELTIGPWSFGGGWQGGTANQTMALDPVGGTNQNAWVINGVWSNGPYTLGFQYFQIDQQGAVALSGVTQEHEAAFGMGGNYQLAPGMQIYAEYLYAQKHQGDYNFLSGSAGSAYNNDVHTQSFVIGTLIGW